MDILGLGSITVAGWVAHLAFWTLLIVGVLNDAMRKSTAVVCAALWVAGYYGLPHLGASGAFLVTPYVAILDVVLVLVVLRGDIRF